MDERHRIDSQHLMSAEQSLQRAKAVVSSIIGPQDDRPSLVSVIACDIGAEIVEGIYPPGADLNSVELSRRYNTSRTPVREAILLLEKEGLVSVPPRRRPRAIVLTKNDTREIYRTRGALVEFIAADVARLGTDEDIERLAAITDRMSEAHDSGDLNAYLWANVEFHDLNTNMANNQTVKRIIDSLLLRTLPLRRLSLSKPDWIASSLDDHLHLVKAYRNRDSNLAAALLRSNHTSALRRLEELVKDED